MILEADPGGLAPATPVSKAYAVRAADLPSDRSDVLQLWRVLMSTPPEGKYDWLYLGHPIEPPTLLLLTCGPLRRPVGTAGMGARRFCFRGESHTAGVLGDLTVLPDHRTLYPALLLQKQMRKTALALHSVVYGLPNKNSLPIVRRLGYTNIGEVTRYSAVLRHSSYLERHLPGWLSRLLGIPVDRSMRLLRKPGRWRSETWQASWVDGFDARFDSLWDRAKGFDGLIGVRDAQFLAWRFLAQPGHVYRIFVVTESGESGISGYAVCEAVGTTLHVRDFLTDLSSPGHLHRLVHLLAREASKQGFFSLSTEFLGPQQWRDSLEAAGMRERGKRTLYASFGSHAEARIHAADWYVTSGDEDQ